MIRELFALGMVLLLAGVLSATGQKTVKLTGHVI